VLHTERCDRLEAAERLHLPPAFHSTNLFFDNVGIRHYVIEPLFRAPAGVTGSLDFGQGGTYLTDKTRTAYDYCGSPGDTFFAGFTGIDRQTILNDDDGSLTGLVNSVTADQPARLKQTISVNEDSFFDAPVKTAECKSNVGVDPDKACPKQGKLPATPSPSTAMTSPYDYVTTVIVPGCSLPGPRKNRFGRCGDDETDEPKVCTPPTTPPAPPAPGKFPECCNTPGDFKSGNKCVDRFSKMQGRGGTWSSECGNESCYGVPLYRQLLTGNDGSDGKPRTRESARWFDAAKCNVNPNTRQCRWPFMRMAGENFYQRNTLTVNHGTYFIDTGVPREVQYGDVTKKLPGEQFNDITPCDIADKDNCKPRSVNVFKADETYYVFFLYAKQSTEQTYQIYVGNGFDTGTVMGVQMNISVAPVSLAKTFSTKPGPDFWLKKAQVDANGILTVNVDFKGVTDLEPTAANLCQPKTFCQAKGGSCVSALVDSGPNRDPLLIANPALENEVNKVCGTWAVKDLDCPKDGCFGFSFKLPSGFKTDATIAGPTPHRPAPAKFPDTSAPGQPDWTAKFERTTTAPDNAAKGACFYSPPLPGDTGCDVVEPTGPASRAAAQGSRRRR
jgi:cell migration-inducing and hyaluronan-binding protein